MSQWRAPNIRAPTNLALRTHSNHNPNQQHTPMLGRSEGAGKVSSLATVGVKCRLQTWWRNARICCCIRSWHSLAYIKMTLTNPNQQHTHLFGRSEGSGEVSSPATVGIKCRLLTWWRNGCFWCEMQLATIMEKCRYLLLHSIMTFTSLHHHDTLFSEPSTQLHVW